MTLRRIGRPRPRRAHFPGLNRDPHGQVRVDEIQDIRKQGGVLIEMQLVCRDATGVYRIPGRPDHLANTHGPPLPHESAQLADGVDGAESGGAVLAPRVVGLIEAECLLFVSEASPGPSVRGVRGREASGCCRGCWV